MEPSPPPLSRRRRDGATIIEYVLIAMIVSLSVFGGSRLIGTSLADRLTEIAGYFGAI